MRRFDVFELKESGHPYVMNVQADILSDLKTCIIIPLIPLRLYNEAPYPRLIPLLPVEGEECALMTLNMGAQRKSSLGTYVTNLESHRHIIVDSIDFLLQGY